MDAWINPSTRDYEPTLWTSLAPGRHVIGRDRIARFKRASAATYIDASGTVRTVAADAPRFESDALLVEAESTNYLTQSEFRNGVVDAPIRGGTVTAAPGFAGLAAAIKVERGGVVSYAYKSIALDPSTLYMLSMFVRFDDGGPPVFGSATVTSPLNDFTMNIGGNRGNPLLYQVYDLGSSLFRVSYLQTTNPVVPNNFAGIVVDTTSSARDPIISGCELRKGESVLSSYVPTSTAAATRQADVADVIRSPRVGVIGSLQRDPANGLANAAYLRLMTPLGQWFGDVTLGSRLHELQREKDLPRIERLALQYARAALQPLLTDGRASLIDIQAVREKDASTGGRLLLAVVVTDAVGERHTFQVPVRVA